jgi:hypothetical protein
MGDAQRGDDALYYYAANLGLTQAIAVTATPAQTSDIEGALTPGRYLLQIADVSNSGTTIWVRTGKFEKGVALSMVAGVPWFPMKPGGVIAIEINVRKGDNDRIAAVASGPGTPLGTLYVTQISRGA